MTTTTITLFVILALAVIANLVFKPKKPVASPTGAAAGGNNPPAPTPATPKKDVGVWGWCKRVIWLVLAIGAGFCMWRYFHNSERGYETRIDQLEVEKAEILVTKEKETWTFWHISKSRGYEEFHFDVTVDNENGELKGTAQRSKYYNEWENIFRVTLTTSGKYLRGPWASLIDEDHGHVEMLKQTEGIWTGGYTSKDGDRICGLRKEVSKNLNSAKDIVR